MRFPLCVASVLAACGPPTHHTTDIENACAAAEARLAGTQRHALVIDTVFTHPWLSEERRGCMVFAADSAGAAPIDQVMEALEDLGWIRDLRLMADGPDGTTQGIRRDDLLCVVVGEWDGGDDADSTYVPSPGYRLRMGCWREAAER